MAAKFNHTIIHAKNRLKSAEFLCEMLGLPKPREFGHFLTVQTDNEVSLDFFETSEKFDLQHYAFLVSDGDFDQILEKIKARRMPYWADPGKRQVGQTYSFNGGRGVYFEDPSGHLMEAQTRPYFD